MVSEISELLNNSQTIPNKFSNDVNPTFLLGIQERDQTPEYIPKKMVRMSFPPQN